MVRPLSSGQRGREERTWEGRRQDRRGRAGGGQGRDRQEQTDRCVLLQVSPACPSQGRSCHCPLSPRLLLQGVLQEHLPQALPLAARAPPRTAQATGATLSQSPGSHGGTERAPAGIGQVLREQAPLVTAVPLRAMDPKDPARVSPAPMGGGQLPAGIPIQSPGWARRPIHLLPSLTGQSWGPGTEEGPEGKASRKELGTQGGGERLGAWGPARTRAPKPVGPWPWGRGRTSPAAGSALGQDVQGGQRQRLGLWASPGPRRGGRAATPAS